MTDQKNGQEYLSFVLEKLQARLAEISQSLLDGQKEIENMHDYYWQNYTEMDQYGYEAVSYTHLDVYKRQGSYRCRVPV